jgi:hypothetical protein
MKIRLLFLGIFVLGLNPWFVFGQHGIGTLTPNASAILDVSSTSNGVLVPRMTHSEMLNITSPVAGLQVFNTTHNCIFTYGGGGWNSEKKFISNMVARGDTVTLGNLMVRLPLTGNSSGQLAFKSGTVKVTGVCLYSNTNLTIGSSGVASFGGYIRQSENFSSTFSYFQSGLTFNTRGNVQQIWFTDETNLKFYKVNIIAGPASASQSTIEIEEFN